MLPGFFALNSWRNEPYDHSQYPGLGGSISLTAKDVPSLCRGPTTKWCWVLVNCEMFGLFRDGSLLNISKQQSLEWFEQNFSITNRMQSLCKTLQTSACLQGFHTYSIGKTAHWMYSEGSCSLVRPGLNQLSCSRLAKTLDLVFLEHSLTILWLRCHIGGTGENVWVRQVWAPTFWEVAIGFLVNCPKFLCT